jgi:hypothetical protein
MSLDILKQKYTAADKKLRDLETEIERTKVERSGIAKQILDVQGNTPFDLDGKEVSVANMKGTYFLRVPFKPGGGRKKKETPTASA